VAVVRTCCRHGEGWPVARTSRLVARAARHGVARRVRVMEHEVGSRNALRRSSLLDVEAWSRCRRSRSSGASSRGGRGVFFTLPSIDCDGSSILMGYGAGTRPK
jgi:hypothetical protein